MDSQSLFVRMGGRFLRIVACARQLIRDPAYFTWNEDGAMAVPAGFFWQELCGLLCDNYARGADEARACEGQSTHSEAGKRFRRRVEESLGALNSPAWCMGAFWATLANSQGAAAAGRMPWPKGSRQ